jgi:hypothetical protein
MMYELTFAEKCTLAAILHRPEINAEEAAVLSKVQNRIAELEREVAITQAWGLVTDGALWELHDATPHQPVRHAVKLELTRRQITGEHVHG